MAMPYSRKKAAVGVVMFVDFSSLDFGSSINGAATKTLVTPIFMIRSNDNQAIVYIHSLSPNERLGSE